MLVYRVCRPEEFEQIIGNGDFSVIGGKFTLNDTVSLNSHEYEEDGNYLHFFKELSSIILLANLKDHYLCYYDLPEDLLDIPYEIRKHRAMLRDNITEEAFQLREKASIDYDADKFDHVIRGDQEIEVGKLVKSL